MSLNGNTCTACGGKGVTVRAEDNVSIPCRYCAGKNRCPTCGRRMRSKNHKCYIGSKKR